MAEDYEYKGTAEPLPQKPRKVFRPDWRVTIFAIACFLFLLNLQSIAFYRNRVKGLPGEVLSSDNLYPQLFKFWIQE